MAVWKVIILAVVQGLAELLPVSSSAHVIVAEKLMGMNPAAPEMTLLLVMLHTGTMLAVIFYFWPRWRRAFFENSGETEHFVITLIWASFLTGVIGYGLIKAIEKFAFPGQPHAWVEELFDRLDWIGPALAAVGVLILISGLMPKGNGPGVATNPAKPAEPMSYGQSGLMGAVQGLAVPFRGFSRSGSTISAGLLAGVPKMRAEDFSFALAVILTPPAIAREAWRLAKTQHGAHAAGLASAIGPSLLGSLFALVAGLLALKWLSRWLESGRWYIFGIYCLFAAGVVLILRRHGF